MELNKLFISMVKPPHLFSKPHKPCFALSNSHEFNSLPDRVKLAQTLQAETLKVLEWDSICKQFSSFTSTSMGFSTAQKAQLPVGQTREESQKLLDQTAAARMVSQPLDFAGIEDLTEILNCAASGRLLTIRELCSVWRTLKASREMFMKLQDLAADGDHSDRYLPLLAILQNCDMQTELERLIEFCIDCNLLVILDRASEELEMIRSERKRNLELLDSMLKVVAHNIFQAGAIDRPLITRRRSRMCVGIRASHRHLLPQGVVLSVSSSGATYFMEPKEAVELNNMEVRLSNSEKEEEIAILNMLVNEIVRAKGEIKHLIDTVLEVDLAFARAAYAKWLNGACPVFCSKEAIDSMGGSDNALIDIDGCQHPLLLESSLPSLSVVGTAISAGGAQQNMPISGDIPQYPVPVDFKIGNGTRVVVISGPNTGGKTASMKTLGLASVMSKAGMHFPAKGLPKLPWFDLVLADIGDHQSLEHNLSTFSGHITNIRNILRVASNESLVLIDEIGCGTDPSEGVALSTSILQFLKDHVNLAVVTTHFADLSCLKDRDSRFENAAMEFSVETLQPTYQILWGSTGDSNALTIAKSIGFDENIITNAQKWVDKLKPEKQQERRGFLYQSLLEERNRLKTEVDRVASIHAEVMELYREIKEEAEDLETRETVLKEKEAENIRQELNSANTQIETVVQDFDRKLKTASPQHLNSLIRKSESSIASVVKANSPRECSPINRAVQTSYTPQTGEQVLVKGLGNKYATVVEAVGDEETILVQYGKVKVRVSKSSIRAIPGSKKNGSSRAVHD